MWWMPCAARIFVILPLLSAQAPPIEPDDAPQTQSNCFGGSVSSHAEIGMAVLLMGLLLWTLPRVLLLTTPTAFPVSTKKGWPGKKLQRS
jgi:hypothetical protein